MKRNIFVTGLLIAVLIGLAALPTLVKAQTAYTVSATGDPDIKVLGTSNLHNWTMEAKAISCSANFNEDKSGQPQSITSLNLTIPVENLKSGKSLMDSKAYTALKMKKFNNISLVVTAASIVPGEKNQFLVKGLANLTIAGVTKPVPLTVRCTVNPNGTITCTGAEQLKMTDYQISPPTYMLGALKTGDALTVDFTLTLNKL